MPAPVNCPVTAEELQKLYEDMPSDRLAAYISEQYGIKATKPVVLRWLKQAGIQRRVYSPFTASKTDCPFSKDRLYELYWKNGLCCREIGDIAAQIIGKKINDNTVQRWLGEYNIRLRTPHEWLTLRAKKDPKRWSEHAKRNFADTPPSSHRSKLSRQAILKGVKAAAAKKLAKRETRTCVYCGKEITRPPSEFNAPPERTCCSFACSGKFKNLLRLEKISNGEIMPKRINRNSDEYSTFELAEYIGCSRSCLLKWLREGKIPEPPRKGNKRIWTKAQADELKKMIRKD
jgi:transposase